MLVGLVGFIGAGKGSVADILVERHGFAKESFANSLKDACSAIFGWDRELLEGSTAESRLWRETPDAWWSTKFGKPFSPRLALQLMGTEAGRGVFHPDLWVHTVLRRCENNPNVNYAIADVRFPNEINAIKASGGKIVRVRRGPDQLWYDCAFKQNTTNEDDLWVLEDRGELMEQKFPEIHFSEWAWIGADYDITFDNSCSLKELSSRVDFLVDILYNNRVEEIEVIKYEDFR
jgi:hypothetical protein